VYRVVEHHGDAVEHDGADDDDLEIPMEMVILMVMVLMTIQ
jgi:hypothetical protein